MNSFNTMAYSVNWAAILAVVLPIIKVAAILVIGHFLIAYAVKLIKRWFDKSKLDPSLISFLTKAIRIILYVLLAVSALGSIGISTTGIIAALSAAGLAIAVALKDSLSNVAGGILLLVAPRFSTGDFIEAGGDSGTVVKVDLLHTLVRTPDNRQISIPNGVLINSHITNYSREAVRRVDIIFQIAYESDAEKAKEIALQTIHAHSCTLTEPEAPMARVSGYGDSSVNVATRTWCNSADYWTLYFDLTEQVRAAFEANGISIPYNQLDVHIKER